ncbi:carbon-nitrogen hydrolase family protein [Chloroflexota bacterium]
MAKELQAKVYSDSVTVACVNFKTIVGDKAAALEKIKDFTAKAANQGANIILFPETALTSFSGFPPEEASVVAETVPGPATAEIWKVAAQHNVYVCFGLVERVDEKFYNSAPVVGPTGVLGVYRKVHILQADPLKVGAGRERWATRGSEYPLIETPWGPIGVSICYDTYCFPEASRAYALRGARLLLHLTASPLLPDMPIEDSRNFHNTTLGARAIENNMFIACANFVGKQGPFTYFGHSAIYGPKQGHMNYHIYAGPAGTEEEIIMATLDLAIREKLLIQVKYILDDRRPETYFPLVADRKSKMD